VIYYFIYLLVRARDRTKPNRIIAIQCLSVQRVSIDHLRALAPKQYSYLLVEILKR